jgi:dTDP-4-dehydrorhamnose 3,5-epimerase
VKITEIKELEFTDVKVVKYARFCDHRGYFTEHYRKSDFHNPDTMGFMKNVEFVQCNESFSRNGTIRGLHFQWNPYIGKLIRTLKGRMIDMILDIRKDSPTFGKIILYDMSVDPNNDYSEWIWVPPGYAHGNIFTEDSMIEYFCSGQYNPACEAGISPLAKDIDWNLCDPELKRVFDNIVPDKMLISEKDKRGFSVKKWEESEHSGYFIYGKL